MHFKGCGSGTLHTSRLGLKETPGTVQLFAGGGGGSGNFVLLVLNAL